MMTATSTQSKYVFESQIYGISRLGKAPGNYDSGAEQHRVLRSWKYAFKSAFPL